MKPNLASVVSMYLYFFHPRCGRAKQCRWRWSWLLKGGSAKDIRYEEGIPPFRVDLHRALEALPDCSMNQMEHAQIADWERIEKKGPHSGSQTWILHLAPPYLLGAYQSVTCVQLCKMPHNVRAERS